MILEGTVDISGALKDLNRTALNIKAASDKAVGVAARVAKVPMQANLSFAGRTAPIGMLGSRTGRLRSQLVVKMFKQRNGLLGASVKVMGDRAHIANMNEFGTKSHGAYFQFQGKDYAKAKRGKSRARLRAIAAASGRTALPARKMFELTWRRVQAAVYAAYGRAFDTEFNRIQSSGVQNNVA